MGGRTIEYVAGTTTSHAEYLDQFLELRMGGRKEVDLPSTEFGFAFSLAKFGMYGLGLKIAAFGFAMR